MAMGAGTGVLAFCCLYCCSVFSIDLEFCAVFVASVRCVSPLFLCGRGGRGGLREDGCLRTILCSERFW